MLRRFLEGLVFACGILAIAPSAASDEQEYSIVWGTALANEFAELFPQCAEGHVCMDAWFRFTIRVEKVIAGFPVEGDIKAARIQHAEYILQGDDKAVFVLSRIKTDEEKELVGADYYLREWSRPQTWHCFRKPIESYARDEMPYAKSLSGEYASCIKQEALFDKGDD